MQLSDDIRDALARGLPVVALESTIITHGMPWPENIETALAVEETVRDAGAIPATIAVLGGDIRVGLDRASLEALAGYDDVMKLSRADLAMAVARKRHGSTTVAATMIIAHRAGIEVFATGGIGGVHRGADESFDVSADLKEFARTPVTVVSAGAKAILDIPATLEVLETLGVPVIAWQQDDFPAFWSRSSGLPAPLRVDDLDTLSRFIRARRELDIDGGCLIANPVPVEAEIPLAQVNQWIDAALVEAEQAGIRSKAVTPWLLERIVNLSEGRSLACNRELIVDNARLAARLAIGLKY